MTRDRLEYESPCLGLRSFWLCCAVFVAAVAEVAVTVRFLANNDRRRYVQLSADANVVARQDAITAPCVGMRSAYPWVTRREGEGGHWYSIIGFYWLLMG